MEIENPYVIVHKPVRLMGKVETILAGPSDVTTDHFALALADAIAHVARWAGVRSQDVLARIQEEVDNPTSDHTGGAIN